MVHAVKIYSLLILENKQLKWPFDKARSSTWAREISAASYDTLTYCFLRATYEFNSLICNKSCNCLSVRLKNINHKHGNQENTPLPPQKNKKKMLQIFKRISYGSQELISHQGLLFVIQHFVGLSIISTFESLDFCIKLFYEPEKNKVNRIYLYTPYISIKRAKPQFLRCDNSWFASSISKIRFRKYGKAKDNQNGIYLRYTSQAGLHFGWFTFNDLNIVIDIHKLALA